MLPELALLDLRLRRRSMFGYAIGLAAYTFVIVAMYPSVKGDPSLEQFVASNPTAAAAFGVTGSLTSPLGWVSGNIYTNFLPLMMLLLTVGYGAAAIAGQAEDGLLGVLATLPVSRTRLVLEKTAAMVVLALPLASATAAVVVLGRQYNLHLGIWAVVGTTLAVLLLGLDFGLLALAVGVVTGKRGIALAVGAGVASVAYLISSLAPVVQWVHRIRFASPFFWAVGDNQLAHGPSAVQLLVLTGVAVVLLGAALVAVRRLDIP